MNKESLLSDLQPFLDILMKGPPPKGSEWKKPVLDALRVVGFRPLDVSRSSSQTIFKKRSLSSNPRVAGARLESEQATLIINVRLEDAEGEEEARDWINDLATRMRLSSSAIVKSLRKSKLVKNKKVPDPLQQLCELFDESKTLDPIMISSREEFLDEGGFPGFDRTHLTDKDHIPSIAGDDDSMNFCLIHRYCGGAIISRKISSSEQVLFCNSCPFHEYLLLTVKTIGHLRTHFDQKLL